MLFSLLISLNSFSQTKANEIKIFEGELFDWYMFEGDNGFILLNKGKKYDFCQQGGPLDKTIVKCKIGDDLLSDIIAGLIPKGVKLKIKAKAVYIIYHNVSDGTNSKIMVWKPIEITRVAK